MDTTRTPALLVELFVEELPPKALKRLGEAFGQSLHDGLRAQGLLAEGAALTSYASPRRLAARISAVRGVAPPKAMSHKLMPVAVGLDATGAPTPRQPPGCAARSMARPRHCSSTACSLAQRWSQDCSVRSTRPWQSCPSPR